MLTGNCRTRTSLFSCVSYITCGDILRNCCEEENLNCWLVTQMSLIGNKRQPTLPRHFALLTSMARLGPNLFLVGHYLSGKVSGQIRKLGTIWGSGLVTGIVQG